jgi:endonuclease G
MCSHTSEKRECEIIETEDNNIESKNGQWSSLSTVGLPLVIDKIPSTIINRSSYTVSYNATTRLPNWVMWHLTAEHTDGPLKRMNNFHEDEECPLPRATLQDYRGSGWSRGHMCPAGDNKWDGDAMYESFLLTNCCPQNANLNSGTWNQIEISCRRWAEMYGDIYIVCGPIFFRQEHEMIGENNVVVPEAFFKVIVCLNKGHEKGIGFICRNTDGNRKKDLYVNSIRQVERITGMTFFPHLSATVVDKVKNEADINDWE